MQCDVFMLPTRYPNEGQPISILEAMGNGMTIITTNHAGIPDIVEDGVNGFVIDKKEIDIDKCYQMLLKETQENMSNIIKTNRENVCLLYSQKRYIRNMQIIWKQV